MRTHTSQEDRTRSLALKIARRLLASLLAPHGGTCIARILASHCSTPYTSTVPKHLSCSLSSIRDPLLFCWSGARVMWAPRAALRAGRSRRPTSETSKTGTGRQAGLRRETRSTQKRSRQDAMGEGENGHRRTLRSTVQHMSSVHIAPRKFAGCNVDSSSLSQFLP